MGSLSDRLSIWKAAFGTEPWVRASTLGFDEEKIYDAYTREAQLRGGQYQSVTSVGESVHLIWQRRLAAVNEIIGTDYNVVDPVNRVEGRIDLLLASGIPVEIKSVASKVELDRLSSPKASAQSQANFYALAVGAPYAHILYVTRDENENAYKLFTHMANQEQYLADLARHRYHLRMMGSNVRTDITALGTSADLRYSPNLKYLGSYMSNWLEGVTPNSPFYEPPAHQPMNMVYPQNIAPWRGMAAAPYNEMPAVAPLGDYNRKFVKQFRTPMGGVVQHLHDTAKSSKRRSKTPRSPKQTPVHVGSRRERTPVAAGR